jgi:hypothetical protein
MRDLEKAFVATKKLSRPTLYRYRKQLLNQGKIQVKSEHGYPPHNVYFVPGHHHKAIEILQLSTQLPIVMVKQLENIPWIHSSFYVTDVKEKVIWTNDETGATMILLKSPVDPRPAGHRHIHPKANQWSFGLAGEAIDDNGKWAFQGSTSFIPKGVPHGPAITTKETLALVFWDGPRTYTIIDDDYINETE